MEFNLIKGDPKKLTMEFHFSSYLQDKLHNEPPIFTKPDNLKFNDYGLIGGYEAKIKQGKVEKTYIIESKNPIESFYISLFATKDDDDRDDQDCIIKIDIFADNKLIKTTNFVIDSSLRMYSEVIYMGDY